ncbi:MAG: Maf family protein [Elusimicrobia bacterium]|nr:Maf family protein [Elusimicrobiota bacterium]
MTKRRLCFIEEGYGGFRIKKGTAIKGVKSPVILASVSPRRIALLKQWGLKFKIIPSHIKEHTLLKKPSFIVKELALRKAESVAKKLKEGLVIGADTIVVLKGHIIGKPADELHSREILKKLNGSFHKVYTGIAVIDSKTNQKKVDYEVSRVKMRKLSDTEINKLAGKHMDKAGAYAVQEKDDAFVEKIFGDYYNVVGLPYKKTKKLLKYFNIKLK